MLSPDEVDAVVEDVLKGNTTAYRSIVESYEPKVRAILAAMGPDVEFVGDLCQEVFIKAYMSLGHYHRGTDFGKWISGVSRNVARQEIRHRMREAKRMLDYRSQIDLFVCEADPEDTSETNEELMERLKDCMGKLPTEHASLLHAFYFDKVPSDALAEKFQHPVNWLRVTLHRIKERLLACMERTVSA